MDKDKGRKSDISEPEKTTVVSRSGRVIKRSSKLLGFESSDLQEKGKTPTKQSKLVPKRKSSNQEPHVQVNDDSNMEFLGDQQNIESDDGFVDTKAYEYTESSGSSVGENNQFICTVKNVSMKEPRILAFVLWAEVIKRTLVHTCPNNTPQQTEKTLREMWKSVPNDDKIQWIQKAKKVLDHDGLDNSISNGINDTAKIPTTEIINNSTDTNDIIKCQTKLKALSDLTKPINVAAHFALLGESLSIIGQQVNGHQGQIAIGGSVSVLLDSFLCTIVPIMCLTQEVTQLNVVPQEILSKMMDDIAFIMPGLSGL